MSDSNLVPHVRANPAVVELPTQFVQQGDRNIQVGNAEVINNLFVMSSPSKPTAWPSNLSAECFHLLVGQVDCEQDRGAIIIQNDRALSTGSTVPQLVDRFGKFTAQMVQELKTFPAVIAAENEHYGRAGDDQVARIGFVTDIRIHHEGIKIEYFAMDTIAQHVLNDLREELDLWGNPRFNELNQTHWALKNVDLFRVLHSAKAPVTGPMMTLWGGMQ